MDPIEKAFTLLQKVDLFGLFRFQITAVDCQPMFDGGILINVLGQLKVFPFSLAFELFSIWST